jgi:hypothetical protein
MNIPDLIFENFVSVIWVKKIHKVVDADPDPGHPGSATLSPT